MNYSPELFIIAVAQRSTGVGICVLRRETYEYKNFFLAGLYETTGVQRHMDSLTDELLLQWFVKREKKPKKGKKNQESGDAT